MNALLRRGTLAALVIAFLGTLSASGHASLPLRTPLSAGAPPAGPVPAQTDTSDSAFDLYGDARFRFEHNTAYEDRMARSRQVLRVRLGAEYVINERLTGGARLVTGSLDDPNATDVTVGDFNDSFQAGLDLAYLSYGTDDLQLTVGKFRNPFLGTDLVWDGDVNPQGAAGTVQLPSVLGIEPQVSGLFFFVDERPNGPNSLMGGGQIVLRPKLGTHWSLDAGVSYYDYDIRSLAGATGGDTRSNRLTSDGSAYRSDFNLVDLILRATYSGFSTEWPIGIIADYVKNTGAFDQQDEGLSLDVFAGRRAQKGDLRVRYGYARAEVDAVFAAFSHNNLTLATNYRRHALSIDYVALEKTRLNLTWYLHQPLQARWNATDTDYRSRFRVNVTVSL